MSTSGFPIVPSYGGLALQLQTPMQHGDGRRLLTNPALLGLASPPELIGRVVCLHELFYVAGPACYLSDEQVREAAVRRSSAQVNRHLTAPARRLYQCRSQADALATLWELVVAHYAIPATEVAEQVARQQRRTEAETNPKQALAGELTDDWIPDYPQSADE